MFILKNSRTADIFGPYATRRHAYIGRASLAAPAEWEPVSIGRRTKEQALELGAAITSTKLAK